jgi:hypothetical protein
VRESVRSNQSADASAPSATICGVVKCARRFMHALTFDPISSPLINVSKIWPIFLSTADLLHFSYLFKWWMA